MTNCALKKERGFFTREFKNNFAGKKTRAPLIVQFAAICHAPLSRAFTLQTRL